MQPTEAFERIYHGCLKQLLTTVSALVTTATGAEEQRARMTAMMLMGQAMTPRSYRAALLHLLECGNYEADTKAAFQAALYVNVEAILQRLSAESGNKTGTGQ